MANSKDASANQRFWDRYNHQLRSRSIKPSAIRWYVKRAEQFIAAFPNHKLQNLEPDQVNNYLKQLGQNSPLEDWQFCQAVDAIQILFITIQCAWVNEFDWQYWLDSSQTLPQQHSSTARAVPAFTAARIIHQTR